MLIARYINGQLSVEGSPLGLSSTQIVQRMEKNLFKIDSVHVYRFVLPKYLQGKEFEILYEVTKLLDRIYDNRLAIAGEVGKYFLEEESKSIVAVLFVENAVYSVKTAREFRKVIDIAIGRVKRPYHVEWKEMRRSANQASYVKPSQTTISDN